jgi:CBS domain-containing protein
MAITACTYAKNNVDTRRSFQSIREVIARPIGEAPRKGCLDDTHLSCQKGMKAFPAGDCTSCRRLVNVLPTGSNIKIRCLWTEEDMVADAMTLAPVLVTVEHDESIEAADAVAQQADVRHLLVVDSDRLAGIVCRCDLVEEALPEERVIDRAVRCPWVISPNASLLEAAELMSAKGVGILPVVAGREVLGVITRGDLRRIGVDEALLATESCAACGNRSGVRAHPRMHNVSFCLECIEQEHTAIEWSELGAGD